MFDLDDAEILIGNLENTLNDNVRMVDCIYTIADVEYITQFYLIDMSISGYR